MPPAEKNVKLTEAELRDLIKTTIHDTLLQIGIENSSPMEMQRDFQHLREWRQASEAAKRKGLLTIVGILTLTIVGDIILVMSQS
jgi:hypothetical protein